ncbi:hypothetical protein GWN63_03990 [Candidatus Bathyarchaeota archaeon]|nr:hypothetical protein [Candidatus Bathyarchaeota archaeon]NIR15186.1 hypothetical protein [Desulfobacterales bacterium]NIU81391.1 hypothetical protein [Candidatus Bathyarchaeota archaeon]NIV68017.1 hypothetical protein [Candidatus Bathyarchaeota archaeon]NIW34554.1 hypothetical protein [Candidatus Bathyarchaeota archaeon]
MNSKAPKPDYDEARNPHRRFFWELNPGEQLDNIVIDLELKVTSNDSNNNPDEPNTGIVLTNTEIVLIVALLIIIVDVFLWVHLRKHGNKAKN